MKAPARLGRYGAGLVAVFAVAFATAGAVVPAETVQAWTEESGEHATHNDEEGDDMNGEGGHAGHDAAASSLGLGVAQDGYQLTGVSAPSATGADDELSLTITGPDGEPVTDFETEHEKELHLIVVRADGQQFRHVHPEMDADGTWSIPWQWDAAGTYRVFADFVPAETGEGITLSTTVQVPGEFETVAAQPTGGDPITDHRWVVQEELSDAGQERLADGTEVTLAAAHMDGMDGATATIASSTDETVYVVDFEADGMTMTNHKWVVESEIQPAS